MDFTKLAEQTLNNLNNTKESTKLLPTILRKNKLEIYAIEKALNKLDKRDRELIERICINGENPKDLALVYGISSRRVYKQKEAALKKFTTIVYGIKIKED